MAPGSVDAAHGAYVDAAGPRFQEAYLQLAAAIRRVFPHARAVMAYDMPMWRAQRPPGAPMPDVAGTIDAAHVHVGLVERKAGLTLHAWYPGDYHFLDARAPAMAAAGLKTMRGCLQFTRKGPFPIEAVERLLEAMRDADAAAALR